jgi:hypothetical protein
MGSVRRVVADVVGNEPGQAQVAPGGGGGRIGALIKSTIPLSPVRRLKIEATFVL